MKRAAVTLLLSAALAACQSLPGPKGDIADDVVLLKAHHCLEEKVGDQNRIHFGPCLKIISINDEPPQVSDDGFITLPVRQAMTIGTSCVYRHADGTPIPSTVQTRNFPVASNTFTNGGQRWYLHAHKQARQVIGCEPTLSRSVYPTRKTD